MQLDPTNISLLQPIIHLMRQVGNNRDLHASVREHRLRMELEHFRYEKPRRYDLFHASKFGLGEEKPVTCMRMLAYTLIHSRNYESISWKLANIFETGHDIHAKLQGFLGWIYRERFRAEVVAHLPSENLTGTCDGVVDYVYEPGHIIKVGAEFKSSRDRLFPTLRRGAMSEHIDQGNAYMHMLGLDALCTIYENKNDQSLIEFVHLPDPVRWNRCLERAAYIRRRVREGPLPPRQKSNRCKWCAFARQCRPNAPEVRPGVIPHTMKEVNRVEHSESPSSISPPSGVDTQPGKHPVRQDI